jgi:thiol-disulfide isomerase/thioredoxin
MRNKSIFLICFLFYYIGVFSQEKVVIKGRIMNAVTSSVYVSTYTDFLSFSNLILDSCKLNENGTFSLEFEWSQPGPAKFFHGNEYTQLYLLPGDDYELELDVSRFDSSVVHTTNGANLNAYYAQKYLRFLPRGIQTIYKESTPIEFLRREDSILYAKLSFLDSFYAIFPLHNAHTKAFYDYEFAELYYEVAEYKLSFEKSYNFFNKHEEPFVLTDTFYHFLDRLMPPQKGYYESYAYLRFIQSLINHRFQEVHKLNSNRLYNDFKLSEILNNTVPEIRAFLMAKWIVDLLNYQKDHSTALMVYWFFISEKGNEKYKTMVDNEIKLFHKLDKGSDAPSFSLIDLNGNLVSLKDFEGKVVYLDFWASWCAPCVAEVPYAKVLKEKLKNKNIEFLYISLDNSEEKWKIAVENYKIEGVHLYLPGNFDSEIAKNYNIKGIPHYVIIDKEGKIYENKADRPSGNVINELELLLDL